jgi:hypothetical protein
MGPNDADRSVQPPSASRRKGWGVILIILGLVGGGCWTLAILLGESLIQGIGGPRSDHTYYFGTILTALATIALIVAGILLVKASSAAAAIAAGKNLVTAALCLMAAAVAAYIFGFVVCWTGH